jgi:hypothetical protein
MPDRRILLAASLLVALGLSQSCSDSATEPALATEFTASLSDANERPNAYSSTATGITNATAAHIHVGKASVAGGIIIGLSPTTPPTGTFTGTFNSGTLTATDLASAAITLPSLAALIRNGDAYVNVHTVVLPGGEIRGQLVPK